MVGAGECVPVGRSFGSGGGEPRHFGGLFPAPKRPKRSLGCTKCRPTDFEFSARGEFQVFLPSAMGRRKEESEEEEEEESPWHATNDANVG